MLLILTEDFLHCEASEICDSPASIRTASREGPNADADPSAHWASLTFHPHFSWQKFGDEFTKCFSMAVNLMQKITVLCACTIARILSDAVTTGQECHGL